MRVEFPDGSQSTRATFACSLYRLGSGGVARDRGIVREYLCSWLLKVNRS